MKYLIDTSCYVHQYRSAWPIDIAVSFWAAMKMLHLDYNVYLLDRVSDELTGNDDLVKWIRENVPESARLKFETQESVSSLVAVSRWAANGHYTKNAIEVFTDTEKADIYIISYAAAYPGEFTVVTEEVSQPLRTAAIKMPDACSQFNVPCINLIGLFRELHLTF